jgi:hypothetical protein
MCNKCNNKQTMSTGLFNALYDSPLLLNKQPDNGDVYKLISIFQDSRPWFAEQVGKHRLHPMVNDLLCQSYQSVLRDYITDWREMVLEWPHVAMTDPTRLAYTQSDEKGKRDQQTLTSLGKYLRRHMPDCPDHMLRDYVARYTIDSSTCDITTDLHKMIHVVQTGPKSCMQSDEWGYDDHPYNVYTPDLGWGMAYRMQGGEYWGRALVNVQDKIYVRSYKRNPNASGYSHSDEMLEAWLSNEGYSHICDWEGYRLAKIHGRYDWLMPYLDGDTKNVAEYANYFEVDRYGGYVADRTDGSMEEANRETCDCCGDDYHEDDMCSVGEDGDTRVCDGCRENHYTYVIGRRGNEYDVHNEHAVYCESDDQYYDGEYLDWNEIVYVSHVEAYYKRDEVWYCEGSCEYFTDDVPHYEINGDYYHEDYLPDGWEVVDGDLRQLEAA